MSKGSQEKLAEDLLLGSGVSIWCRSREPSARGVCHGGVSIAARHSCTKMSEYNMNNPDGFEVMAISGYTQNVGRKFFVIGAYIPPNYTVPRAKSCLQYIYDQVMDIKTKFPQSYLIIAGDFNQWDIGGTLADFPDLWEVDAGPTRGVRKIDRVLSNLPTEAASVILPPLCTDFSVSDHSVVRTIAPIPCREKSEWIVTKYRKTSKEAQLRFVEAMTSMNWQTVLRASGSESKAAAFHEIVDNQMDKFFPFKISRRRDGDLPWLDACAKKKIKKKKAIYRDEGKSDRWVKVCENLEKYLEMRQESYLENQRNKLLKSDADKQFHKNVKNFHSFEKPKQFNVADVMPGESEEKVAESASVFFNSISKEFRPLKPEDIPASHHRRIQPLTREEVAKQIRTQKKPGSMISGDIFPKLINSISDSLAVPLTSIYNEVIST